MVVGFDFGTHQTKICIEDRSDVERPIYKFWRFKTENGNSYALPTVIQINNDDTLTYGAVERSKVKYLHVNIATEPVCPNVKEPVMEFTAPKPVLKLPEKPKKQKQDWKDVLRSYFGNVTTEEKEWEKQCEELKLDYDQDLHIWQAKYDKAISKYTKEKEVYDKAIADYVARHQAWEEQKPYSVPAIFRYFKQATFSKTVHWEYSIDQDYLSVWYIANILFDLEKEYGQTFSIQFGYPTDARRMKKRRQHAYCLLLSAYHLVEDVFKGDKDSFLLSTYQELIEKTELIQPTPEKIEEFGLLALPEAYANLVTATTQKQIAKGISFVVDIGGGTTDISLFTIDNNNEPHIYGYSSIGKGINYIVESANSASDVWEQNSLSKINGKDKDRAVQAFRNEVLAVTKGLIDVLYKAFEKVNLDKNRLTDALNNRVVVYTGGGSTYSFLCKKLHQFTDIKNMDSKIWKGFFIEDASSVLQLAPILSTALGLSIQRQEGDVINVSNTEEIFAHLPSRKENEQLVYGRRQEELYGMLDD